MRNSTSSSLPSLEYLAIQTHFSGPLAEGRPVSHLPSPPNDNGGESDSDDAIERMDPSRIQSLLSPMECDDIHQEKRKRTEEYVLDTRLASNPPCSTPLASSSQQSLADVSPTIQRLQTAVGSSMTNLGINLDFQRSEPNAVDKFINGIWKQIYSSIEVAPIQPVSVTQALSLAPYRSDSSTKNSFETFNSLVNRQFDSEVSIICIVLTTL